MSYDIQPYIDLIRSFLDEEIPVEVFEKQYLDMFKAEKRSLPQHLYEPLNWVFTSIDVHVPDKDGRVREPYEMDDSRFLKDITETYSKLLILK